MPNPYEKYILPRLIDAACSQPPMTELRSRYVSQARGKVLEIGIGSGLNLKHYGDAVESITGVDPAAELTEKARRRAEEITAPVEVLGISGESLDLDNNAFDTIVCTWTLCSIPNPYRAVDEMRRVLKPGGQLIFVEHGRSDDEGIAKFMSDSIHDGILLSAVASPRCVKHHQRDRPLGVMGIFRVGCGVVDLIHSDKNHQHD